MSYEELYAKAKKDGVAIEVTSDIKQWEKEGDYLIGKVIDVRPFEGGKFDTRVNQYLLETDQGNVSTILGAATDKQLENKEVQNRVLYIEYKGKVDLGDGKRCNKFTVNIIDPQHVKK